MYRKAVFNVLYYMIISDHLRLLVTLLVQHSVAIVHEAFHIKTADVTDCIVTGVIIAII